MRRTFQLLFGTLLLILLGSAEARALLSQNHAGDEWRSTPKYRVMGYEESAPGRLAFFPQLKLQLAMGCEVRGDEIASGQGNYCNGDPVNGFDPDGRCNNPAFDAGGSNSIAGALNDYFDQHNDHIQQQWEDLVYNTGQQQAADYEQWANTPAQASQQDIDENTQQFYSDLGTAANVASFAIPGLGEERLAAEGFDMVLGEEFAANMTAPLASNARIAAAEGAEESVTVYRVFGGDARAQGFSWTPVNPESVSDFRNLAGLPSGGASGATNTAEFLLQGRASVGDIIKQDQRYR